MRTAKLGFVFQSFNLLPRTNAALNVLMPLDYGLKRPSRHEAHTLAEKLLRRVGLGDRLDHEPSQMSGGQQQRVAIARSLVNSPALVLADEPTGNLDSHTSVEILEMFQQLNAQEHHGDSGDARSQSSGNVCQPRDSHRPMDWSKATKRGRP